MAIFPLIESYSLLSQACAKSNSLSAHFAGEPAETPFDRRAGLKELFQEPSGELFAKPFEILSESLSESYSKNGGASRAFSGRAPKKGFRPPPREGASPLSGKPAAGPDRAAAR